MEQLTQSTYLDNGARYKNISSPQTINNKKQIETLVEDNGVLKYKTEDGEKDISVVYGNLSGLPTLNTNNDNTLTPNESETINGSIDLHKISKTGDFKDLLNVPESSETDKGIIQIATDEDIATGTDTTKATTPKQLKDNVDAITMSMDILKEDLTALDGVVVKTEVQTLTEEQKAIVRNNIGAGASGFSGNFDDLKNIPIASENLQGIIQIANTTDVNGGTNTTKAITPKQLKDAIDKLGNVLTFKGSKATFNDLPKTNNKIGDVWFVIDESVGYVWIDDNGVEKWEKLGLNIDLTNYLQTSDVVNSFVGTETDKPLSAYIGSQLYNLLATKLASNNGKSKVYGTDAGGNQQMQDYSTSATANTIVKRTSNGRVKTATATENDDAITKATFDTTKTQVDTNTGNISTLTTNYGTLSGKVDTNTTNIGNKVDKVSGKGLSTNDFTTAYKNQIDTNKNNISTLDSSKLNKVTEITKVYATDGSGNQTNILYHISPTGLDLVQRTSDGRVKTTEATEDDDAVTRGTFTSQLSIMARKDMLNVTYPRNTMGTTTQGTADRVVETFISSDGKTWYRKWKSGWKECSIINVKHIQDEIIALPLAFSSTNFTTSFCLSQYTTSTGYPYYKQLICVPNTNNTVKVGDFGALTTTIYCSGY